MAGSLANTARTRVVLSRERPSTRASTEPHDGQIKTQPRFARGTAPPPPPAYEQIEISIGKPPDPAPEGTGSTGRYVKTVSREALARRQSAPDLEPHIVARELAGDIATDIAGDIATDIAEIATDIANDIVTNPFARSMDLAESTMEVDRVLESLMDPKPVAKAKAAPRPLQLSWLGVVLTPPEVGGTLVIGTWLRKDFCVTSEVTRVVQKDQGVLVRTLNHHYFVKHGGDTYLVRER